MVDENQTYKVLNYIIENKYEMKNKGKSLMHVNREKFTLNNMAKVLNEIVEKYTKDLPEQVSITLPKLKKVTNKQEPSKILPKLKKVTTEGEMI